MSQKPKGRVFLKMIVAENVKCTEVRKIKPRKCLLDIIRMSFDEFSEQFHWCCEGEIRNTVVA